MINTIRILMGEAASNYTDAQIDLCAKMALSEVESYCNRTADYDMELCAQRIAILKLYKLNSEGLASQSFSGVSETYIDGYPADILAILNRKRKIKVV